MTRFNAERLLPTLDGGRVVAAVANAAQAAVRPGSTERQPPFATRFARAAFFPIRAAYARLQASERFVLDDRAIDVATDLRLRQSAIK
jgi:hypothetical protein